MASRRSAARLGRLAVVAHVLHKTAMLRLAPACLLPLLALAVSAAEPIPVGPGRIEVNVGVALEVFTYRPPTFTDGPLILVFHGVQRNAEDYRNFAIAMAERFGAVVAAPRFDKERFPYESYQLGGVRLDGAPQPREHWTFSLVPKLAAELRRQLGDPARPLYLVGHSAGGQFVERLAGLSGDLGAVRLVAANPGSHLFPDRNQDYGYGFGRLPDTLSNDEALRRYLAVPLTIYLGTADTDPNHSSLDRRDGAQQQGEGRHARGLACFRAAQQLARDRGWPFHWRLVEATGIPHEAARMFAAREIAHALFGTDTGRW